MIAFPKNKDAVCLMTQAPNVVDPGSWRFWPRPAVLQRGSGRNGGKSGSRKLMWKNVANLFQAAVKPGGKAKRWQKDMEEIVGFCQPAPGHRYGKYTGDRPRGETGKRIPGGYAPNAV